VNKKGEKIRKIFAERLENILEKRGIRQIDLAYTLDTDKRIVNRWVKAGAIPNIHTQIDLADYLNVSLDYLLGRTNVQTLANPQREELLAKALNDLELRKICEEAQHLSSQRRKDALAIIRAWRATNDADPQEG